MLNDAPWLRPALGIALLALATALSLRLATNYPAVPSGSTSLSVALLIVAVSAIVRLMAAILAMWRKGVADPIRQLRAAAPAAARDQAIIVAGVAVVGLLLFSVTFMKSMIPAVVPFWADEPFDRIDRMIGLDIQALALALRQWLKPIGYFYGLWHAVNLGGILWVIHWRGHDRGRYILSFMLTWAIGMTAAFVFSSAGPLFTGRYDLAIAPDSVRVPAEMLWANYRANGALLGGGISAFPSLHVAIAAWFASVLAKRGLLWIGIAYVVAIYAGSIILGWHYGADGLGGILIAVAADRLAQRLNRSPRATAQPLPPTLADPA